MKVFTAALLLGTLFANASALSYVEKKDLLRRAVPLSEARRQLNDEQEAITIISSTQSIQFNTCISLSTELSDELKQTLSTYDVMKDYYEEGEIVALKNFVLFNVCESESCNNKDESNLYMIDLPSYMGLTGYMPQKTIDYCDACEAAVDWCSSEQSDADADISEENSGGRKLNSVQYVDCDKCTSMGCFEAANQNQDSSNAITIENMYNWAQGWSQCQETGVQWNNVDMFASFLCNEDGSGVELGIFLDDECTTYSKVQAFSDVFPNDSYHLNSGSVVTYPFTHKINCTQDIQWESPENANDANQDDVSQDDAIQEEQNQNDGQVNQYCQALFSSESALSLSNCDYGGDDSANQQEQGDGDDADDDFFSATPVDLSRDDLESPTTVCSTINTLQQAQGSYHTAAQSNNHYKNTHGSFYNYRTSTSDASGMSGGEITGIIIGVLCVCGFLIVVAAKLCQKKEKKALLTDAIYESYQLAP